jgi:hypothetical protein
MARSFVSASTQSLSLATAPVTAAGFTCAAWANVTNITAYHPVLTLEDTGGSGHNWILYMNGGDAGDFVSFQAYDGSSKVANSATAYSANTWHHVAGIEAASNSRTAWIDGVSGAANTTAATPTGIDRTLVAGRIVLSAINLNGLIRWPAVWNVVLSAGEMLMLARGVSPKNVRRENLVFFVETDNDRELITNTTMTANNGPTVGLDPPGLRHAHLRARTRLRSRVAA